MKILALLVVLLSTVGCIATWRHPTKGKPEFYQDITKCRVAARQAVGPSSIWYQQVFDECMYGEGWEKVDR